MDRRLGAPERRSADARSGDALTANKRMRLRRCARPLQCGARDKRCRETPLGEKRSGPALFQKENDPAISIESINIL